MKNSVFWDVPPCESCVNRRFGGMYRLCLLGRKIRDRGTSLSRWLQTESPVETHAAKADSSLADLSSLKMETIRSSETSVHTKSTRRQIPEDGVLHESKSLPPSQPTTYQVYYYTCFG
jgi:hypothetical protein